MSTQQERMTKRIRKHGENLSIIFPERTVHDPIDLCKKLRRLEAKASRVALDLCNGDTDRARHLRHVLDRIRMDQSQRAAPLL